MPAILNMLGAVEARGGRTRSRDVGIQVKPAVTARIEEQRSEMALRPAEVVQASSCQWSLIRFFATNSMPRYRRTGLGSSGFVTNRCVARPRNSGRRVIDGQRLIVEWIVAWIGVVRGKGNIRVGRLDDPCSFL